MRDTWMRLRVRRSDFAAQRGPSLCVRNVVFTRHAKAPPHGAWSFELGAYSLETWIRFVAPGGPSHVHAASSERDERSSRHSERPSLRFEARCCASRPVVALRSPSLRFELTSVHGELASGQRAPALDDYTLGRNRREARTRHSEVARGAAKSYRALRANFQCSSAASVTFRASSRRCEKASSQASNLRHHACSDAAAGAGYHGVEARIQSMRARGAYTELSRGSAKLGRRHGEAVRGAVCSHVLKQSSRVASVNRYR